MQLLQKYIAYARQYCHPVLSDDAKQILKEYYCKLRQDSVANEGTPVTVSSAHLTLCCSILGSTANDHAFLALREHAPVSQ